MIVYIEQSLNIMNFCSRGLFSISSLSGSITKCEKLGLIPMTLYHRAVAILLFSFQTYNFTSTNFYSNFFNICSYIFL